MASAEVYYHGTRNEFPFEAIRPSPGDIGIHFGNFRQAKWRVERQTKDNPYSNYRHPVPQGAKIFEVYLDIKNPLEMPDAGNWNDPCVVADALVNAGVLEEQESLELAKQGGKEIARKLQSLGYDAVAYENYIEGTVGGSRRQPSGWSVIIFDPAQIKAYRVHSVWEPHENQEEHKQYPTRPVRKKDPWSERL